MRKLAKPIRATTTASQKAEFTFWLVTMNAPDIASREKKEGKYENYLDP